MVEVDGQKRPAAAMDDTAAAAAAAATSGVKRARHSLAMTSGTDSDDSGVASGSAMSPAPTAATSSSSLVATMNGGGLRLLLSGIEHYRASSSSEDSSSPSPPASGPTTASTPTTAARPPATRPITSRPNSSGSSGADDSSSDSGNGSSASGGNSSTTSSTANSNSNSNSRQHGPVPSSLVRPVLPSIAVPVAPVLVLPTTVLLSSAPLPSIDDSTANHTHFARMASSPLLSASLADAVHAFLTGQLPETVLSIYHANVAQKSYGTEKRFLCPPPMVNITGRVPDEKPSLRMSIIDEANVRSAEHKATTDENDRSTFKYLHVTDTSHARRFHLSLRVAPTVDSVVGPVFDSRPISIISKPSKKTNKARSSSLTITSGSLITLFNRVNSQTVRTKYMGVENRQLCAKNSTWSAFQILLVNPPAEDPTGRTPAPPITYGTQVVLRCTETNVYSGTLTVKKVVNDTVVPNATGTVSQMQKVALAFAGREHLFLSILPTADATGSSPFLCYQPVTAGRLDVDPHLIWTIVGVERTVYRYVELARPFSDRALPIAQVYDATVEKDFLELGGRQFSSDTVVCVGSQPLVTRVASSSKLTCILPPPLADHDFDRMCAHLGCGRQMYAAILLARADGVVSHSGHFVVSERIHGAPVTLRVVAAV